MSPQQCNRCIKLRFLIPGMLHVYANAIKKWKSTLWCFHRCECRREYECRKWIGSCTDWCECECQRINQGHWCSFTNGEQINHTHKHILHLHTACCIRIRNLSLRPLFCQIWIVLNAKAPVAQIWSAQKYCVNIVVYETQFYIHVVVNIAPHCPSLRHG